MAKKILINYANDAFKKSQKLNSKTGIEDGGFDKVIEYGPEDIDKKFYTKNKHILNQMRLGGYALWKPYIILKTLLRKDINFGDFVLYCDSGAYFINKINHLVKLSKKYKQDIIPFSDFDGNIEKLWSKKDAFILMEADFSNFANTPQIGTTLFLIKKSNFSIAFFRKFLEYAEDKRIITDEPSILGTNYPGFVENRHDQTIFSLLCKKKKLRTFRQPFQTGNNEINLFKDKYPQIIVSTRKNNRTFFQKIKYQKACSKRFADFIFRLAKMPIKKMLYKNKIEQKITKKKKRS